MEINKTKNKVLKILLLLTLCFICMYFTFQFFGQQQTLVKLQEDNVILKDSADVLTESMNNTAKKIDKFNYEVAVYDENLPDNMKQRAQEVAQSYVPQIDYDKVIRSVEYINDVSKKNNKASAEIYNEVNRLNNTVDTQFTQTLNLQENKEDAGNKTDNLNDETSETKYPSVAAFSSEVEKFYNLIFPIGSIYIATNGEAPAYGEWTKLNSGRVLWNTQSNLDTELDPTLPNVKGYAGSTVRRGDCSPAFTLSNWATSDRVDGGSVYNQHNFTLNLNRANTIYQNNATVRPPSIAVAMYQRIG